MHSVLSPVENLTQWKAIKAKVATSKHRRKENVPLEHKTSMTLISEPGFNLLESNVLQSKPLLTEIAVDASLSNWLISPIVSKTTIHCQ
ncbi:protein PFC0760c isoform X2 [Senna tora]|uniref:Protein PFC0760c isoform X2 n=1 Tax=Senna tora TaxID=362788 RepID=A0A834X4H0_9FABA|nr:protein PFC0760c isoform X2 [Senna tora]